MLSSCEIVLTVGKTYGSAHPVFVQPVTLAGPTAECVRLTMTTRLEGALKREITIDGTDYTLTITPQGMTLTLKGRRKGLDLEWSALVSGEAALATALNASLTARTEPPPKPAAAKRSAQRSARNGARRQP
jgi:hypothetical protein